MRALISSIEVLRSGVLATDGADVISVTFLELAADFLLAAGLVDVLLRSPIEMVPLRVVSTTKNVLDTTGAKLEKKSWIFSLIDMFDHNV